MTRQIRLDQIDEVMKEAVSKLVRKTTLELTARVKKATPQVTGNLFRGWQTQIKPMEGTIVNPVEYSEPVVYGVNLPPSWQGIYRTRKGTIKGYPELIAKQLVTDYIPKELSKIIRKS